jgi:polysaccharide biosynthesis/export protein
MATRMNGTEGSKASGRFCRLASAVTSAAIGWVLVLALTGCHIVEERRLQEVAAESRMAAPQEHPVAVQADGAPVGTEPAQAPPPATRATAPATPPATATPPPPSATAPTEVVLREGDTVRVTFPGAPSLNKVQQIRRDGKITLDYVGEVQAAGLTPTALEQKLLGLYGNQLQDKEVTVSIDSSAYPVYVSGAVLRPGKILFDRPVSALEAIMEAGGPNYDTANMKKVSVTRYVDGQPHRFVLNLKEIMDGKKGAPFMLKPSDILYVPERFSWF